VGKEDRAGGGGGRYEGIRGAPPWAGGGACGPPETEPEDDPCCIAGELSGRAGVFVGFE